MMETKNKKLWKSLETKDTPTDKNRTDEFPAGASEWDSKISRRNFLQFSGAALALLGGCTSKKKWEKIVPYVNAPDPLAEGNILSFATSQVVEGLATGLLVQSYQGRPYKIEGNPDHPASLGATSAWNQAFILELFSPARAKQVTKADTNSSWEIFFGELQKIRAELKRTNGKGLRVLTEISTSPTMVSLMHELKSQFPEMNWVQYDPLFRANQALGAELAFGQSLEPIYDFSRASLVVSFDADFLHAGSAPLRNTRDFSQRRSGTNRNYLWMLEASPTLTGASADFRTGLKQSELARVATAIYENKFHEQEFSSSAAAAVQQLARRIAKAGKNILFLAGEQQPPWLHAITHELNARHGAIGNTVKYIEPLRDPRSSGFPSLLKLTEEMKAGEVSTLFLLGGNPVYNSPAGLDFSSALKSVRHTIRLGLETDETAALCQWSLPMSHPLETWGDALAFDGTVTFQQPLIDPLFPTRSASELLSRLSGKEMGGEAITREFWQQKWKTAKPALAWNEALAQGFLAGSARKAIQPKVKSWKMPPLPSLTAQSLEVVFRPDYAVHDGRFFPNSWLQELPRPLSELTWGNALLIGKETATNLQLKNDQMAELEIGGAKIEVPVWILPGHPAGSATLYFGYGRKVEAFGENALGYNAYAVWHDDSDWAQANIIGKNKPGDLACTQEHWQLGEENPVRFQSEAQKETKPKNIPASLYAENPIPQGEYAWGMVIDLSRCTGCKACVVACQSENNIPSVGKEGVQQGREMHWIRIDRYFQGTAESAEAHFQPVPCMHCEKAPCEPVCPVGATLHNDEGLNQMIYNRCVGTRYCSNNCPYKVRRFNFSEHNKHITELERLGKNPDVSLRPRGVMEKCTYCVQRIQRAHIAADLETRPIRDGEVITACQAACPARAIEFGNTADPKSAVSQWKHKSGHYSLLEELGTRPRTTYLAKVIGDA